MRAGYILLVVLFGTLFPFMIFRITILLRGEIFSQMDKRNKYSIIVFIIIGLYGLTRAIVFGIIGGDLVHSAYLTLLTGIPATMYQVLQTSLLVKWNHHVSEVTSVIHNDRFPVGRSLIRSSVGLSVISLLLLIIVLIMVSIKRLSFNGTWELVLGLFFGTTYIFNGVSFTFLGIYMRCLWAPTTEEAKRISCNFLSIALIFGIGCIFRGINSVLLLVDTFAPTLKFVTWHQSEIGSLYVPFIVEWVTTTVPLVILTMPSSDNLISRTCQKMYKGCFCCWRRNNNNNKHSLSMEERIYDPADTFTDSESRITSNNSNSNSNNNSHVDDASKYTVDVKGRVGGDDIQGGRHFDGSFSFDSVNSSGPSNHARHNNNNNNVPNSTFSTYTHSIQHPSHPSVTRKNFQQFRS